MPLYEYICLDCGAIFDNFRPVSEANALQNCKKCNGKNTQRKLATFFSKSGERTTTRTETGGCSCGGCSGGSCGTCRH